MSIKTRLQRLERAQATRRTWPTAWPSVETAAAAGVRGGFLLVGQVLPADECAALAKVQKAELLKGLHDEAIH